MRPRSMSTDRLRSAPASIILPGRNDGKIKLADRLRAHAGRERCADLFGEIGGIISRLCSRVDERAPPQLLERQRRVDPAGVIEVSVYQPVEDVTNVELALPAGSIRIADDV